MDILQARCRQPGQLRPMPVNLIEVWLEITGKLSAAGVSVAMPSFLGWANSPEWAEHTGGGYYPETGELWISRRIAHVPILVRDMLIHEITHQIQYAAEPHNEPHGDTFTSWAAKVAAILDCPSPEPAMVTGWPYYQRPEGFFGPDVTRKERA